MDRESFTQPKSASTDQSTFGEYRLTIVISQDAMSLLRGDMHGETILLTIVSGPNMLTRKDKGLTMDLLLSKAKQLMLQQLGETSGHVKAISLKAAQIQHWKQEMDIEDHWLRYKQGKELHQIAENMTWKEYQKAYNLSIPEENP